MKDTPPSEFMMDDDMMQEMKSHLTPLPKPKKVVTLKVAWATTK
jgi:hypothetical protein